jgi:hypothetical protein
MSLNRLGVPVLAALLGLGAGAGPAAAGEPAALLAVERTPEAVELSARARGLGDAAQGRYELVIVKRGGGGQSTIRQGGALPATGAADGTRALATSRVSVAAGTSLVATLRVILDSGEVLSDRYTLRAGD